MPLVHDVDLLTIEPSVFLEATAAATKVLEASDGAIAGATLSSNASNFVEAGIDAGHVAVVAGEALEVVERISATSLGVSRPRARGASETIPPGAGTDLALAIWTFTRLIELSQAWVFGALGIDEDDPVKPLDDGAILNAPAVARLIALRTIQQAFAIAAAGDPENDSLHQRAVHYARQSETARQQTLAILDTNGDGIADATRRIAVVQFSRA